MHSLSPHESDGEASSSEEEDEILRVIRDKIRTDEASARSRAESPRASSFRAHLPHQTAAASATAVVRRPVVVPPRPIARFSGGARGGTASTHPPRRPLPVLRGGAPASERGRGVPSPSPSSFARDGTAASALADLETLLADESRFRAPSPPPPPEWEAAASRASRDAAAADRDGVDLRRRIDRAKTDVRALVDASEALRQIEEMSAELGDRTASFGRELAEVAEIHGVTLS